MSQPCKATEQNRQVLRCMGRRSHRHSVGVTFRWPSTYVHIVYAQDIRWCLIKRACQSIQYKTLRTKGSLWNSRDEKVPWILSHNVSVSRPYFCVLFESSVHSVFQVKRPTWALEQQKTLNNKHECKSPQNPDTKTNDHELHFTLLISFIFTLFGKVSAPNLQG